VDTAQLERAPSSAARRGVTEEELRAAGADGDAELVAKAQALLELVRREAPAAAPAIGVDLRDVEAGNLRLRDIIASGTGVRVEKGRIPGDIEVSGVRAGQKGSDTRGQS